MNPYKSIFMLKITNRRDCLNRTFSSQISQAYLPISMYHSEESKQNESCRANIRPQRHAYMTMAMAAWTFTVDKKILLLFLKFNILKLQV